MPIVHKYKKTVRCSYCHQSGHNKSTCPQYAARIEEIRKVSGPDHYAVKSYDYKKNKRKASGKNRSCSYCGEKGHNRKTCVALKSDMLEVKARNAHYRKDLFNAMVKHGIFTGAIVQSENHTRLAVNGTTGDRSSYKMPMVITSVEWKHINIWETEFRYYTETLRERAPLKAKPINDLGAKWASDMGFPQDYDLVWNKMPLDVFEKYMGPDDDWYGRFKHHYFPTVISPVKAEKPPLGWLTCDDTESQKTLREFFKKRTSRDTYRPHKKGLTRDEMMAVALARREAEERSQ